MHGLSVRNGEVARCLERSATLRVKIRQRLIGFDVVAEAAMVCANSWDRDPTRLR
jgi:hypothetical protein